MEKKDRRMEILIALFILSGIIASGLFIKIIQRVKDNPEDYL